MTMTVKILVYIALLFTAVSAQTSDAPSDVPSMSPGGTQTLAPASVDAQATPLPTATNTSICELCGKGGEVSLPDEVIKFEDEEKTCSELQQMGRDGYWNISECAAVVNALATEDPCGCESIESPEPTMSPTATITSSAVSTVLPVALVSLLVAATTSLAFIV